VTANAPEIERFDRTWKSFLSAIVAAEYLLAYCHAARTSGAASCGRPSWPPRPGAPACTPWRSAACDACQS